jgi:hypothetical protein
MATGAQAVDKDVPKGGGQKHRMPYLDWKTAHQDHLFAHGDIQDILGPNGVPCKDKVRCGDVKRCIKCKVEQDTKRYLPQPSDRNGILKGLTAMQTLQEKFKVLDGSPKDVLQKLYDLSFAWKTPDGQDLSDNGLSVTTRSCLKDWGCCDVPRSLWHLVAATPNHYAVVEVPIFFEGRPEKAYAVRADAGNGAYTWVMRQELQIRLLETHGQDTKGVMSNLGDLVEVVMAMHNLLPLFPTKVRGIVDAPALRALQTQLSLKAMEAAVAGNQGNVEGCLPDPDVKEEDPDWEGDSEEGVPLAEVHPVPSAPVVPVIGGAVAAKAKPKVANKPVPREKESTSSSSYSETESEETPARDSKATKASKADKVDKVLNKDIKASKNMGSQASGGSGKTCTKVKLIPRPAEKADASAALQDPEAALVELAVMHAQAAKEEWQRREQYARFLMQRVQEGRPGIASYLAQNRLLPELGEARALGTEESVESGEDKAGLPAGTKRKAEPEEEEVMPFLDCYFPPNPYLNHPADFVQEGVLWRPDAFKRWMEDNPSPLEPREDGDWANSAKSQSWLQGLVGAIKHVGLEDGYRRTREFWAPLGTIQQVVEQKYGGPLVRPTDILEFLRATVALENGRVTGYFAFHTLLMEVDGTEHWYWRPNATAEQFRKWQDPGWLAKREEQRKTYRTGNTVRTVEEKSGWQGHAKTWSASSWQESGSWCQAQDRAATQDDPWMTYKNKSGWGQKGTDDEDNHWSRWGHKGQ